MTRKSTGKTSPKRNRRKTAAGNTAPVLVSSFPSLQSIAEPFIEYAAKRIDGNLSLAENAWREGLTALRQTLSMSPSAAMTSLRGTAASVVSFVREKPWHAASLALLAGATLAAGRAAAQDSNH